MGAPYSFQIIIMKCKRKIKKRGKTTNVLVSFLEVKYHPIWNDHDVDDYGSDDYDVDDYDDDDHDGDYQPVA